MWSYVVQGATLGFSAAVLPGAMQAFLLSRALTHGWKPTLPLTLAPLASDAPMILLVLFVLTRMPVWFVQWLSIIGGLFLLWLAVGAWRVFRNYEEAIATAKNATTERSFLKAMLTNLLNPNPWLFWSVLAGPVFLQAWAKAPVNGFSFIGSFYLVMVAALSLLVTSFALAGRINPQLARLLSGVSAIALFAFGCRQLWQGIAGNG